MTAPLCPVHGTPERPSLYITLPDGKRRRGTDAEVSEFKGGWYCGKKMPDGSYCGHKTAPMASAPIVAVPGISPVPSGLSDADARLAAASLQFASYVSGPINPDEVDGVLAIATRAFIAMKSLT